MAQDDFAEKLNNARWAACNVMWTDDSYENWPKGKPSPVPTMEQATRLGDAAVRAFLGMDEDEWREATGGDPIPPRTGAVEDPPAWFFGQEDLIR